MRQASTAAVPVVLAALVAWLLAGEERASAARAVPVLLAWGALTLPLARRLSSASWVLGVALVVRVVLLTAEPHLSDDFYRYLWEGKAAIHGFDPWSTAPAEIDGLDDPLRARVNHPELASAYPPAALAWFVLLDLLGGTELVARVAATLADVGVVAVLLRARAGGGRAAAIWAMHPLCAVESAVSAHLEAPALLCFALAVAAGATSSGGALWATASSFKLLPALVAPALLRTRAAWIGAAGASVALVLFSSRIVSVAVPEGLLAYGRAWSFNGALYTPLQALAGDWARPLSMLAGGAVVGWCALKVRDPLRAWQVVAGAFVLLSPTAHPWYALWVLLPSIWRGRSGWAVATVPLLGSYWVLASWDAATGAWVEAPWLWPATWGVALATLVVFARANTRRDDAPSNNDPPASSASNGTHAQLPAASDRTRPTTDHAPTASSTNATGSNGTA
jgi:hypothetical protein